MPFRFKQFTIADDRCAMKVGTDGVLLGAWTNVDGAKSILDIGTGSGVIALMLAQRTNDSVKIDALEIESDDAQQASENVSASPWPNKVHVINSSLQKFTATRKYDLIVSNPPFFNSLVPKGKRKNARHTDSLSHEDLLKYCAQMISDRGTLSIILPTSEGNSFHALANLHGFYCSSQCAVFSSAGKPQERWLFTFLKGITSCKSEQLFLNENGQWSENYKNLTQDFYLNF
jgi:tRNA1Val (adenine37-N6)-methyltransferase